MYTFIQINIFGAAKARPSKTLVGRGPLPEKLRVGIDEAVSFFFFLLAFYASNIANFSWDYAKNDAISETICQKYAGINLKLGLS